MFEEPNTPQLELPQQRRQMLLAECCLRNIPAEIIAHGQTAPVTAASRFLKLTDHELMLERPDFDGGQVQLALGQQLEVLFNYDELHFGFDSRVTGFAPLQLNSTTTVKAITVDVPTVVSQRQRRRSYRVSVVGCNPVIVLLWPAKAGEPGPEGQPIRAGLFNLSTGGIACVPVQVGKRRLQPGQRFWIRFTLPDDQVPMLFRAELRHVRTDESSSPRLIGLAFFPDANPHEHANNVERIARFVAEQQRRELARRGTRRRGTPSWAHSSP